MRSIPPVLSDYPVPIVLSALFRAVAKPSNLHEALVTELRRQYPGFEARLVDSGTTALSIAIRAAAANRPVAVPAYACPDIGTALQAAGATGLVYDTDPETLSPNISSLRRCLDAGCRAVVVAHFFGQPVDLTAVLSTMAPFDAVLIEDAAQHAGGTLNGVRLGSTGEWSVLSFGRGKGLNGMGGGALLHRIADDPERGVGSGDQTRDVGGNVKKALAAIALRAAVHPQIYALISAIPSLRIGETVYHAPSDVRAMTAMSSALVREAFSAERHELAGRKATASRWLEGLSDRQSVQLVKAVSGACPGALRVPVLIAEPPPEDVRRLGIVRGYPRTLLDYSELSRVIRQPDGGELPGAARLVRELYSLPTHRLVTDADVRAAIALLSR